MNINNLNSEETKDYSKYNKSNNIKNNTIKNDYCDKEQYSEPDKDNNNILFKTIKNLKTQFVQNIVWPTNFWVQNST